MQQGFDSLVGNNSEFTPQYSSEPQVNSTQQQPTVGAEQAEEKVKVEVHSILDDLSDTDKETMCKVFVGNIPRNVMDDEFKKFFEDKVPSIKDVFVMKDMQNPTQNRGFGFLSLNTIEDVDELLMGVKLNFGGRPDIKRASPKDCEDPLLHVKTNRIFLGGLTPTITEEDVSEYYEKRFPPTGKPVEVIIKRDRTTNKPRGFCFVVFQNEHIVDKVMLLERKPNICGKRLDVRKADASGMNPGTSRRGGNMQNMSGYGPVNNFPGNRRGRQMMNMPFNAPGMRPRGNGGYPRGNFNPQMAPIGMVPQQPQYQPYYNRNNYAGQAPVGGMSDPSASMPMSYGAPAQTMPTGHESMYSNYMQQAAAAASNPGQMANPAAVQAAYHQAAAASGVSQNTYQNSAAGAQQGGLAGNASASSATDPRVVSSYAQYIYQRSKQQGQPSGSL